MNKDEMSPITKHLKRRAKERFGYEMNRKARVELVNIIRKNFRKYLISKEIEGRYLLKVPVFLSEEMRKINNSIKFGDFASIIYDKKNCRIITMWRVSEENDS